MTIRTAARHPFAPLYVAAAGVVLLAASVGISSALPAPAPAEPTPTATTIPLTNIAPCRWWENMQVPDLPADTYTDRCVDPDGVIAYADPEDVPS